MAAVVQRAAAFDLLLARVSDLNFSITFTVGILKPDDSLTTGDFKKLLRVSHAPLIETK
jgi:hypothetical protein